jgi:ABC-type transport system involved in multi-copper enzyme maturation permease subunit
MTLLARWFWRLLPGNPMVLRTVWSGSRRLRHQWIRMGYLGALVGLVTLGLMTGGGMEGTVSLTQLAKAGTYVFAIVGNSQLILICLLAPLFMAGAITSEQSGKTYDILLTTPMSNFQIVLGSLAGRLFFVLALLSSGLPLFSVLLLFGGVPISAVTVCFATSAVTALTVGAVAVTLSVMRAGGRRAVFLFVICVAAYLVASYLLDRLVLRRMSAVPNTTTWVTPLHPLLVLESAMGSANYMVPPADTLGDHHAFTRWYLSRPFAAFCSLSAILSAVLLTWCTIILRRVQQGRSVLLTLVAGWLRLGADGEKRRHPRHVGGNPIAWREAHTRGNRAGGMLARWTFLLGGIATATVLLGVYHTGGMASSTFQIALTTLLLVEIAVIALVALYVSAGAVSAEREDGTLDLLLTTPITPRQYIWGKLSGLVRFLGVMLAAPIICAGIVSLYVFVAMLAQWPTAMTKSVVISNGRVANITHPILLPEVPVLLAMLLVPFVAVCIVVGMKMSLRSRRVLGAVVQAVAVMGAVVLVLGFCGWNAAENVPAIGPIINAFSPATALHMLIDPWERINQFAHAPVSGRIILVAAAVCAGGVYSLIVYLTIQNMVGGFDQTLRRLSGTE